MGTVPGANPDVSPVEPSSEVSPIPMPSGSGGCSGSGSGDGLTVVGAVVSPARRRAVHSEQLQNDA